MRRGDIGRLIAASALAFLAPLGAGAEPSIGGTRPAYNAQPLSTVPNEQAIVKRFWAPGLEAGYTPQGLVVSGGRVHVVGYGEDGCRVFALGGNGAVTSSVHVPACRHGGGLAAIGGGRMVVIDTRGLHVLSGGRVSASIRLKPPLIGSYGDFDGRDLWIGSYQRNGAGRIWRIPLSKLAGDSLSEADTTASIAVPARAQGMAFAGATLWMTFSGSRFGRLSRIDRQTGAEIAGYDMPAGIEDIGISGGLIWSVSEAGARKYIDWSTNFPLVFAIDPARLK